MPAYIPFHNNRCPPTPHHQRGGLWGWRCPPHPPLHKLTHEHNTHTHTRTHTDPRSWRISSCDSNFNRRKDTGDGQNYAPPDPYDRDAACRFVSVRAGRVCEVLRSVSVRDKIRLHVTRFVSCVSEMCLRVTRVGIRAPHCVFVCLCVSCVPRVTRVACHACHDSCVSCVSRVMSVWIGCGSVRVRVRLLRVCGSCLFLRVLAMNK
jgi:hypothetical protein